jgi:hypothetical protein
VSGRRSKRAERRALARISVKRKRQWFKHPLALVAGPVVLAALTLLATRWFQKRDEQQARLRMLNAVLAEIQTDYRIATDDGKLLRSQLDKLAKGGAPQVAAGSALVRLHVDLQNSLTGLIPLFRNDGATLNRMLLVYRNGHIFNEQLAKQAELQNQIFDHPDHSFALMATDSVAYSFCRDIMGLIESPDTLWRRMVPVDN